MVSSQRRCRIKPSFSKRRRVNITKKLDSSASRVKKVFNSTVRPLVGGLIPPLVAALHSHGHRGTIVYESEGVHRNDYTKFLP